MRNEVRAALTYVQKRDRKVLIAFLEEEINAFRG